uniref:Uncharacterized protein n=1 Tax=Bombyx mori TaxID=7091 RepID=A0A8R2DL92_BOMMO|nr:uncharacterized protein LOC110385187 [Bombyx mori]
MFWRRVSKLQRTVLVVFCYLFVYLLIFYSIIPDAAITFVDEDFSVGDKYVFMFLSVPETRILKESDSVALFERRKCGKCFITNNRGFMPIREYDAVLHLVNASVDEHPVGQEKKYVIQTSKKCINNKFRNCVTEPVVLSFISKQYHDLCSLCRYLHLKRNSSV